MIDDLPMAETSPQDRWHLAVDTGGTFTDCLAIAPDGAVARAKVLSSGAVRGVVTARPDERSIRVRFAEPFPPGLLRGYRLAALGATSAEATVVDHGEEGVLRLDRPAPPVGAAVECTAGEEPPVLGARIVTRTPLHAPLPPLALRLATTRGTNALLERRGARTALVVTEGFADLLVIGDQRRAELFSRTAWRPPPLHDRVVEVDERLAADGAVVRPLGPEECDRVVAALRAGGVESVAVALLHAWRNPVHEELLEARLRAAGFGFVSVSATLASTIGFVTRASTAVTDAYLAPVVRAHLDGVGAPIDDGTIDVLSSAGGLVRAEEYRPKDSLLSGPAGGAAGAMHAAVRAGHPRAIGLDMGGTSTDVARFDGDVEYVFTHQVGDASLASPAVAIETVAAGGGSICHLDGRHLAVGPHSAGASPGPACYGLGGPLTLTDVDLILGRLDARRFGIPVDPAAAHRAAEALHVALRDAVGAADAGSLESMLEGLLQVADETMAGAIRAVSMRRGHDPADHALIAFGGAGGLHACGIAELLGMRTVVLPPDAGLLSAVGVLAATPERIAERTVLRPIGHVASPGQAVDRAVETAIRDGVVHGRTALAEAERTAHAALERDGIPARDRATSRRILRLRLQGQETCLDVEPVGGDDEPSADPLEPERTRTAFDAAYREVYGQPPPPRPIELESVRVVVRGPSGPMLPPATPTDAPAGEPEEHADRSHRAWVDGAWRTVPVHPMDRILADDAIDGPAVLLASHASAWIGPGWTAGRSTDGAVVARRTDDASRVIAPSHAAARTAVFASRIESIATEMGELLRRTALSVNVKERLDYSCGVLDAAGELVANAPHVPVHLGALGVCVRAVQRSTSLSPGDVIVTNHPAAGGSHLPDVTVVSPVFHRGGRAEPRLVGFVASRAHHAEIGGIRPGSMPPDARSLDEEGVTIPVMHLVEGGVGRLDRFEAHLRSARWPSRAVGDNLADVQAQVAANLHGVRRLDALAGDDGADALERHMQALADRAESLARAAIDRLPRGLIEATDTLDDGTRLAVSMEARSTGLRVDFTGSGPVHPGNFNATPAIVRSAVMYVVRLLVDAPIPLNEGLLRPVSIHLPRGVLAPPFEEDPRRCPPVGAGNTETSQRVVDLLVRSLGIAAGSQATMNNLLFGNERFGYYETIGGGAGAVDGRSGGSAVHSHMTNTRITDAEVMEHRYPVRVERFEVRRGSGGGGRWSGGDGSVRVLRFLEPVEVSIVSGRRTAGAPGAAAGSDGMPGTQRHHRGDGSCVELEPADAFSVDAGDRVEIQTPGGGGWG